MAGYKIPTEIGQNLIFKGGKPFCTLGHLALLVLGEEESAPQLDDTERGSYCYYKLRKIYPEVSSYERWVEGKDPLDNLWRTNDRLGSNEERRENFRAFLQKYHPEIKIEEEEEEDKKGKE